MIVGLDDTDSRTEGMCTTYLATLLAESISGYATVRERLLTRLNPNIEHRTRGNACLTLELDTEEPQRVKQKTLELVEKNAVFDDDNTNPGVAFFEDEDHEQPEELVEYTLETIRDVKTREEARQLANEFGIDLHGWKNSRGIIGALAAIGAPQAYEAVGDYTHELLAYRSDEWDEPRKVDYESFFDADSATYPRTWDTVDHSTGSVVCVPNTSGPVIYGIRGESLEAVWEANSYVEASGTDHVSVFRSNQGTDTHLIDASVSEVLDNRSYRISGVVSKEPENTEGGHVFFSIKDRGNELMCAAFEPTKGFRDTVRKLRRGDHVVVCGSVKDSTMNVEKMRVTDPNETEKVNPRCPECGNSMKSAGRDQGYRCRDCGTEAPSKVQKEIEREIEKRWYEVPPSARRHLSKPLVRDGLG